MVFDPAVSESERHKELGAKLVTFSQGQEERLAQHRSEQLGIPYINLVVFPIDSDVLERVSKQDAMTAEALLFYKQGGDIRIGAVNPTAPATISLVAKIKEDLGYDPHMYVISKRSLLAGIARYRRDAALEDVPQDELKIGQKEADTFATELKNLEELGKRITTMPPTEILTAIAISAVRLRASDIHIEPKEKSARLRFRIDGVLQDIVEFERDGWSLVLSRVKVMARLKLNIHDAPQDGSFVLRIGEETYDMRLSTLPGGYGENIVIRLLNRDAEAVAMKELGMKNRDLDVVNAELKRVNGMILITGPTGSGKTTTLASFLRDVNVTGSKIITLEDPIEYRIPGIEQTQVDPDAGYTFAAGLRSILRQDPDVIMVGEMRDVETAETAVHAALTGHLVFSTLHTNDAAGAIPRLIDMGIKPYVLAPALNLVIAQRLVRVVCTSCAQEYDPDVALRNKVKESMKNIRKDIFDPVVLDDPALRFMRAVGCQVCGNTGYHGRLGAFEIFAVDQEMKKLILEGVSSADIQKVALQAGMTTIAQDAYLKVIDKKTTIDEVERVSQE
ncbi:MAG: GspE/PulE family protein [Candidatus Andersenbacteria bacterium]|nr:GspE/PulE family protein [Candidatus Andersenbacteria bacterium]